MTPSKRDMSAAVMDHTVHAALDAIQTYLRHSKLQSQGAADFATLHLVTRSLTDLVWAQNLATAGFPMQAYSLMRPAWEAVNLCDLFAQEEDAATQWAEGKFWELTPAKVRRRLGSEGGDAFYSFMAERSHPRFAGLQMTIFKKVDPESDGASSEAILHLNDIPLEVTAAYMAVATPAIILSRLALQVGRLNFEDAAHKPTNFVPLIRTVADALKAGWSAMDVGLEDWERDDPEVRRPQHWAESFGGVLHRFADHVEKITAGEDPGPLEFPELDDDEADATSGEEED